MQLLLLLDFLPDSVCVDALRGRAIVSHLLLVPLYVSHFYATAGIFLGSLLFLGNNYFLMIHFGLDT